MFAVGEETSKPETSYSYDENFIATPHQITQSQETLFVPLHSVFLSFFFVYWDHYRKFVGFDSLKPLKKY